jgi:predicted dehydrogenase/threonine dehydrogenase-like Zn-dependent dehydrogenase
MKQVLQNLRSGTSEVVEAPAPHGRAGHVLIDTSVSLISTGTERMLVDFGRAGLVSKARQQPEKVKQVLAKARTDGLATTIDAVRAKLGAPVPLGYCNVGVVRESGVEGFKPGDRVASNGPHADVVLVPKHLCAKVPEGVDDEAAVFTVAASIGLQGIRLAAPTLGETVVVTGVGLIGLLTVQMLRAQGCRVLAIDFDVEKLSIAKSFGAETCNPAKGENPVAAGLALSGGAGVDAVIITASTKSSDPVSHAAQMCRKRGRIVLVGVTGLELNRADFYDKELSFQVSCSYGPGRYDPAYEEGGQDYPISHVRWTEQRNFEAVLGLMASGALRTESLVSHRFVFDEAPKAYDALSTDKAAMGILLTYSHATDPRHIRQVSLPKKGADKTATAAAPVVGFLGAGNYGSRVLMPAFAAAGATLHTVVSASGTSSVIHGRQSGFAEASTDPQSVLDNPGINTVAIVTRHNSHANYAARALRAGKHVFVEKPLALTTQELTDVEAAYSASNRLLMVGFNRRFAPQVQTMKRLLGAVREAKSFIMVMNAGNIPKSHWTQDPIVGGGRIIGEACHYIDLMRFLAGAPIVSITARRMGDVASAEVKDDKAAITLGFADGSFGTIHYLANGSAAFPKERIEVFAAGATLQLDNFLKLKGFGWPGFAKQNLWRQDKGQAACAAAFVKAVKNGEAAPIPVEEIFEVSRAAIEAACQLATQD